MFGGYETTLNYQLPEEVLQTVMEEAVDRYLADHQTVFPIERKELSIKLKVQKSWRGNGEIVVISIKNKAFYLASKCIEEHRQPILAWAKNWNNVRTLATYLRNDIYELSYNPAQQLTLENFVNLFLKYAQKNSLHNCDRALYSRSLNVMGHKFRFIFNNRIGNNYLFTNTQTAQSNLLANTFDS